MFAIELIQSLIDNFTTINDELFSCYLLDESHEVDLKILVNSKNVIIFRNSLITPSDIEIIHNKITTAVQNCNNITILTIFLNSQIVESLIKEFPKLKFFTIYHSSLFDSKIKAKLEENRQIEDYSYSKEFMDSENMCRLFRKLMLSFLDDY